MSYHPIIGITIFFVFVLLAFFLGRVNRTKYSKIKNINIKEAKKNADSISPDAHWLKQEDK